MYKYIHQYDVGHDCCVSGRNGCYPLARFSESAPCRAASVQKVYLPNQSTDFPRSCLDFFPCTSLHIEQIQMIFRHTCLSRHLILISFQSRTWLRNRVNHPQRFHIPLVRNNRGKYLESGDQYPHTSRRFPLHSVSVFRVLYGMPYPKSGVPSVVRRTSTIVLSFHPYEPSGNRRCSYSTSRNPWHK